ncbi:hypothetical protein DL96DRAFT_1820152 [Flagelloscypha sp. PMI_526]|nr:hypothetical protein DL96DRAFT_1820152 [Flagelloscypha sp. PMI_526]
MGAFGLSVGAMLIGCSLNLYFYGFVSYQYYIYKTSEFNDPIWLRVAVAALFMIDTSQTIIELYLVWHFTVENYTNPSALSDIIWVTPFCGMATAITTLIVQAFLINRLRRLTGYFWFCAFLMLAALVACGCGVTDSIWAWLIVDVSKFSALVPLTTSWLAIEASLDVVITIILSRVLWRSKTGFTRTNTVINRCVRAAIQSGLFSSVFAFCHFLVFFFWPYTYLYAIFHYPLGRIYSNSLIYTLVARKELAYIAYGSTEVRVSAGESFSMSPQVTSIRLHRETITDGKVADGGGKTPMDRNIVFPSEDTE